MLKSLMQRADTLANAVSSSSMDRLILTKAQEMLASSLTLSSFICRYTFIPKTVNNFLSGCRTLMNTHAVLATSCSFSSLAHCSATLAKTVKSFTSRYVTIVNAQAVLATLCA
eukprot:gnl/TRDRNA2_/TRDRNA2_166402_c2_seq4.p1 gnl/TRDRNA2_/TRDRNA2_166402_c2~~gnl/TRDRNA2_/TRDRNA2_166402_c2_seq4.p1  ORF type:complete len:113 (-),score=12.72 gnl/TRDRNA2_/TRDRNA2_166402_c2_seq4:169-507(-)